VIPSGDDPTDAAQRWVDGLGGRRILVAGIGLSGVAAARALLDRDAQVVVVDGRDGVAERAVAVELTARGAQVRLGDAQTAVEAGLVVTSPGWRPDCSQPRARQTSR